MEKGKTVAFQIPVELFQRIKQHLERETLRLDQKYTQREFVLNLIAKALDKANTEYGSEPSESEPNDTPESGMLDTADMEDSIEANDVTQTPPSRNPPR